jgi:hypothetical protein
MDAARRENDWDIRFMLANSVSKLVKEGKIHVADKMNLISFTVLPVDEGNKFTEEKSRKSEQAEAEEKPAHSRKFFKTTCLCQELDGP